MARKSCSRIGKECFRVAEKSVSCATRLAYSVTSRLRQISSRELRWKSWLYIYIYSAKRPSRRFHKFPGFKRRHFVTAAFPNGSLTKRFDVYTTRYKKYNFRVNFRLTRWKCFAKISIRKEISIDRIRAYMNKLENLGIVIRLEEEKVRKIGHR